MNPTEQLAHFSGATNDLSMTGLWYSHKRVAQLVEAAKAEAWDEGALCRAQSHPSISVKTLNPYRATQDGGR